MLREYNNGATRLAHPQHLWLFRPLWCILALSSGRPLCSDPWRQQGALSLGNRHSDSTLAGFSEGFFFLRLHCGAEIRI
jgi:hypothetical protein